MKIKIGFIVLVVVCFVLLVILLAGRKATNDQRARDAAAILEFSNQLFQANTSISDLGQVNLMLTNDVSSLHQTLAELSNRLEETASALSTAKTTLTDTKASLATAETQVVNLNGRITDLEAQNKALDDRATELSNQIAGLNDLIAATRQKLANSEKDNVYLAAELQKQMAQKAELERKFSDINVVRAQVKKLRDEMFTARRLEWMANGADPSTPPKGAALLMQRSPAPASAASAPAGPVTSSAKAAANATPPTRPASPYDLNVEVGSDGSVHVIPPPNSQDNSAQAAARAALMKEAGTTNAPAH